MWLEIVIDSGAFVDAQEGGDAVAGALLCNRARLEAAPTLVAKYDLGGGWEVGWGCRVGGRVGV